MATRDRRPETRDREKIRDVRVQRYSWGADFDMGWDETQIVYDRNGRVLGVDYTVHRVIRRPETP